MLVSVGNIVYLSVLLIGQEVNVIKGKHFKNTNELIQYLDKIEIDNNDIAELHLYNHIDSSSKDYKYILADFLHYCNQENVISSTINTGYGGAKSIINTVYSTIFSV